MSQSPPASGDQAQAGQAPSPFNPSTTHAQHFRAERACLLRDFASEQARLKGRFPEEFNDGARCGFLRRYPGKREPGGYPRGFHHWESARRNAWFSGFNVGFCDRLRLAKEEAGR
jgi:hypothetical protein